MRPLQESLLDSDLDTSFDKNIKAEIKEFLKQNYKGYLGCKISREPNSDGKYEVSCLNDVVVKNKNIISLTNELFTWSKVGGYFCCINCNSLKSLKGAPKEVGGNFYGYSCKSLESLEGAPEKVGGNFECWANKSLESLEGAPKEIGGNFYCYGCKVEFTENDVKKVSNVKRIIIC